VSYTYFANSGNTRSLSTVVRKVPVMRRSRSITNCELIYVLRTHLLEQSLTSVNTKDAAGLSPPIINYGRTPKCMMPRLSIKFQHIKLFNQFSIDIRSSVLSRGLFYRTHVLLNLDFAPTPYPHRSSTHMLRCIVQRKDVHKPSWA